MSQSDGSAGAEAFEQGDEALDEATRLDPDFLEAVEGDPSLDPTLQSDAVELTEIGAVLDDPEKLAVLDGGMDDPDGIGEPDEAVRLEEEGWDLDAGEEDVSP